VPILHPTGLYQGLNPPSFTPLPETAHVSHPTICAVYRVSWTDRLHALGDSLVLIGTLDPSHDRQTRATAKQLAVVTNRTLTDMFRNDILDGSGRPASQDRRQTHGSARHWPPAWRTPAWGVIGPGRSELKFGIKAGQYPCGGLFDRPVGAYLTRRPTVWPCGCQNLVFQRLLTVHFGGSSAYPDNARAGTVT
jgi:hypothetical protein